jgi:hypothetical protein
MHQIVNKMKKLQSSNKSMHWVTKICQKHPNLLQRFNKKQKKKENPAGAGQIPPDPVGSRPPVGCSPDPSGAPIVGGWRSRLALGSSLEVERRRSSEERRRSQPTGARGGWRERPAAASAWARAAAAWATGGGVGWLGEGEASVGWDLGAIGSREGLGFPFLFILCQP